MTAKSNGVFSGTIANLFPRLAAAKSAGYARVIQSGMVIMQNAIKAQLIKNTSVPFTLGTGEFQQAAKVETGFDLSVLSNIVGKDDVEMQVGLGVTMGHGNQGTSRNTLSTTILVKSTESAVLGGIAVNEGQTSYDKDPPFGADTVDQNTGFPLFSFLRSKSINLNKSQFVVFITPEIIDSPAKTTQEIKKKFIHRRR